MFQTVMLYPINTFQTVFDCTDDRLLRQFNIMEMIITNIINTDNHLRVLDLKEKKTIHHVHMDIKDLLRCNRSHL